MLTRAATWFGLFWGPPPLEELSVDLLTGHWTPSATSKTLDGRLQSANSRIVRRLKLAVMKNSRRLQLIHTGTSVRFICALETSESPSSSPQACICGPVNPSKDRQFRLWLWSGQSPMVLAKSHLRVGYGSRLRVRQATFAVWVFFVLRSCHHQGQCPISGTSPLQGLANKGKDHDGANQSVSATSPRSKSVGRWLALNRKLLRSLAAESGAVSRSPPNRHQTY